MKLYLAGPCDSEHRTLMTHIANWFEKNTYYKIYKPWELKIENAWDYSQEEWARKVYDADKKAIDECDIMLVVSLGRISSAGTNWEQGYAYGIGKLVCVMQIGDECTSLMTYCGCNAFINADSNNDINEALEKLLLRSIFKAHGNCTTVLT